MGGSRKDALTRQKKDAFVAKEGGFNEQRNRDSRRTKDTKESHVSKKRFYHAEVGVKKNNGRVRRKKLWVKGAAEKMTWKGKRKGSR